MDPLLVHRSQESFPVLPETVPFATRNFLRVCIHRASLSAASTSSRCIFRTLSMLNSGVLSEPRRCRPDVGTSPQVGFFFQASMAPGIEISPQPEEANTENCRRCSGCDNDASQSQRVQ